MLLHIHPQNPQPRQVKAAADILRRGGVIIYPTDTIYGLGCDIYNAKAIERICRIKGISDARKAQLSFVCEDLSQLSEYAGQLDTPTFRMLKAALPGPFTFILPASRQLPKAMHTKKETVGIRVPDHAITQALLRELGHPIMSASLPMNADEDVEYYTDPEQIFDQFESQVDAVIHAGPGGMTPSTIIDCTGPVPEVTRQGAGDASGFL